MRNHAVDVTKEFYEQNHAHDKSAHERVKAFLGAKIDKYGLFGWSLRERDKKYLLIYTTGSGYKK